jgi:prepilin-type N-terminal cleavage/methylation domain-containing protein
MSKRRAFTLIELMIVVAIIGVLSAVAIPAFMRYIRRSKTTEATMNLRKLFDSSIAYYNAQPKSDPTGAPLPVAFPDSIAATPAANSCCGQPGDKCKPAPATFAANTWQALNFSVDDPFYYWYQYDSSGTAATSVFTAWAFGNLNCDTVYSTFARSGSVQGDRSAVGSGAIFMSKELE